MKTYKVLFTGAHHNSALAVLDWLSDNSSDLSCKFDYYWIGKKYVDGYSLTPEFQEVTKRNVKFLHLKAGKYFRFRSIRYFPQFLYNLGLIPVGFVSAFIYLLNNRPDIIISFGGYISVPVIISAKILGIPSVSHEQTIAIGLANRIVQPFVEKVYTAWPVENYAGVNRSKLMYSGLPLRKNLLQILKSGEKNIVFENNLPILYVTGGKAGSMFINSLVLKALPGLCRVVNIIWSCGHRKGLADYNEIVGVVDKSGLQKQVLIKEYFMEDEIGGIYSSCDIVLSRSGAHSVYELGVLGKPAILIPIPWSSNDEQRKNAKMLQKTGQAYVMEEESANPEHLLQVITDILQGSSSRVKNSKDFDYILNGSEILGRDIVQILKRKS